MTDPYGDIVPDEASALFAFEPEFRTLIRPGATLRHLWAEGRWTEGPAYLPAIRSVVFSDIPNDRQMLYSELSGKTRLLRGGQRHFVNGAAPDGAGGLLLCEHGTRALTRLHADGGREVLADRFQSNRFNSPNDVVRHPNGTIWFTDPTYGLEFPDQGMPGTREQAGSYVYRFDPLTGQIDAVLQDFAYPNGLAFSPDGGRLYVADSGGSRSPGRERHIRVFDIDADARPSGGAILVTCPNGVFDGFRVDPQGRLWASARDGVYVFTPSGVTLGRIATPETVSNLCFGGAAQECLYITATTSLYAIAVTPHAPLSPLRVSRP